MIASHLPQAFLVHQCKGRVRLRIPERRQDDAYFTLMEKQLSAIPGINGIKVNPISGTVLLLISQDISLNALSQPNHLQDLFHLACDADHPLTSRVAADLLEINKHVQRVKEDRLDMDGLYASILILLAIVQLLRGNSLGPASSLLWDAIQLLRKKAPAFKN